MPDIETLYRRKELDSLIRKLREPPAYLQIVAGPRQVGKTTMVRMALDEFRPQSELVSADKPEGPTNLARDAIMAPEPGRPADAAWLIDRWNLARGIARASGKRYILAIDEIQKVPRWDEIVKGLWDADRAEGLELHVVLLGSSPLQMRRGMTESLAGRYELMRVTHWSFIEMYEAFNFSLDDYLYFGGYPGAAPLIRDIEVRWRSYVLESLIKPSIETDILMMTRVDKPALLKQTFELGCSVSGQILSLNKMLGHLQDAGNAVTLAHYLDLLEQAGLLVGLKKYAGTEHRRRSSQPKFNVLNSCLLTVQKSYTYAEAKADRTYWGQITESAVGAHLYNSGAPQVAVCYWRESPFEVDFVLARGPYLTAIEVMSGSNTHAVVGMNEFLRRNPGAKPLTVGTDGIPVAEFLSYAAEHWLG